MDNRPWNLQALRNWLRNRALIGEVQVNLKNKNKDQAKLKSSEKYEIVPASWDPLIDRDKWELANKMLDDNYRRKKVEKWKYHQYILTEVLNCSEGNPLRGESAWGRDKNKKYLYYAHQQKFSGCSCGLKKIPAKVIERKVLRVLKGLLKEPGFIEALTMKANEEFKTNRPDYNQIIKANRHKLDSVVRKLDRITDQIIETDDPSDKRMWMDKSSRVQLEKEAVEEVLRDLEKRRAGYTDVLLSADSIKEKLKELDEGFDKLPVASRQGFIKSILNRVTVSKDQLTLGIKNPDFDLKFEREQGFDWESLNKMGEQNLVYSNEWLRSRDSNPGPID